MNKILEIVFLFLIVAPGHMLSLMSKKIRRMMQ